MVANGQFERTIETVFLEFKVADSQFQEKFIVMKTLPTQLIVESFVLEAILLEDVVQLCFVC